MTVDVGASLNAVWTTPPLDQPQRNIGFITEMDRAMKEKVSGIFVTDDRSSTNRRQVAAYYNRPAKENRDVSYPYITVNLLSFQRAADREQRGHNIPIPYAPTGYTMPAEQTDPDLPQGQLLSEMPIPYDFVWQIASFARFVEHDREIMFALMQDERLPTRFGYLNVQDTVRYLDLLDGPTNADGYDDSGKRVFRKTWTVRASAEFFQQDIQTTTLPTSIVVEYSDTDGAALP